MAANDIIFIILLLIISAFFSGSEMAYVVSNKLKIEVKARKNNLAAKSAYYFTKNPQYFFSTILIGNNVVNIAFASVITVFLTAYFGLGEFYILLLSTFVLLVLGELIPKYFARELADRVVFVSAIPLRVISFVLYPFIKITASISSIVTQSSSTKEENINYLFTKEDIESLVNESREAGIVNKKESDIITKVLELGDQKVYEAMRPRTEIVGIEITQTVDEALGVFIDSGFSKLPIYEDNLDNIKGVVYVNDIFKTPQSLQSIIKEVSVVPETKKSFDLLNEFLAMHVSVAVVIDEFGGTAGIITMEDIMEELFGEIRDEYDVEESICRRIAPGTYMISGRVEVDYVNEKYELDIPNGDYETVGGFITSKLGRIPQQGENVTIDRFNFLIARASLIKIDVVKLVVNPDFSPESR